MERPVKERLVGAAVLMAAAIILIPEMLSGPDRDESEESARAVAADAAGKGKGTAAAGQNNAPIKTYTIDLSQSPGTSVAASEENRAPPPEEAPESVPQSTSASDAQAKPESADEPVDPSPAMVAATPAPAQETPVTRESAPVVQEPTPAPPPVVSPPPQRPLASSAAAPTSGAWVVQLGSFSKQATAERLMKDMRAQGHEAFVMPVKSGGATLYRVRIGPMKDRAGAEAALRSVKAKVPGAAVVAHP